ncbi:MAG TPA: PBECR2 nuclease fold domain-containing protein [Bacillales bacterium]|nr:PBECR2 nuclease fold domain-containing protein [Bacillales bacterium]
MGEYAVNSNATERQIVGEVDIYKVYRLTRVQFPEGAGKVFMYPGFIKHLQKNHPGRFEMYYHLIPSIILEPDYIGQNPKELESIELYKRVNDVLLLAIKFDAKRGYLFLASFYELDNWKKKIKKRLRTGRIVPYSKA